MINANRPIMNLDLDLLRTFVAVADLNTFAAAAAAVCRTQSAVSQQMQRLEQLVGRELFARHGRNKLLTEHGLQLLGYARQILRANDDASASLTYSDAEGELRIGASDDTVDTLLPFLLNRIASVYPRMAIDVRIKRTQFIESMLDSHEIDLALTTAKISHHPRTVLRSTPVLWHCAPDFQLQPNEPVPLVVMDETNPFRQLALDTLDEVGVSWRIAYEAASLSAVRTAVNAEVGITARPLEMQNADLRILGESEGLPRLPETQFSLYRHSNEQNESVLTVFSAIENKKTPYTISGVSEELPDDDDIIDE
ncbi:transcriptional regulator [Photorhabdus luminescens subsp. luminescens]|uniref:DNA-binding transcriptional regulator, LysR family n=2 Tax=Photorhabdus luminescens TaxID=29488 RepID=A0A1G5QTF9_PHOLU|nr:transcriptional regulator HexA [Photorhabdus luminescens]KMW72014.1 transcriptional regulator [Photorhabdus luminescens subsp. luminescens]MCW7763757.1 transcriptional regulator HexA [Photorhabdus luminescens subsp. venezuelensis]OWO82898.1 transcriptional regulator LrhA [Photorhabdus luminescens]TDB47615.1 transcriptional regulator LrhA [Photorhabdus luminescens subsp. mexicana]SCZ64858.1 DNA-binding transcriptional regulator, LysR family [Photorhabdus luminescens]